MEPNQKKTFMIIAIAVLVVAALVFMGARQGFFRNGTDGSNRETDATKTSVTYSPEIPKNIELTKPVNKNDFAAIPDSKTGGQTRLFNILISKSGYDPDQIVVNNGDIVGITIIAVDGDYDFDLPAIGGYQFVKRGEKRQIGFQALKTGTFTYVCRDHCSSKGIIVGKFIVK